MAALNRPILLFSSIFLKEKRKNEKKRKEKASHQVGVMELSRFFGKILPDEGGVEIFSTTRRA